MEPAVTAIELTGTVDERHELHADGVLPIQGRARVRVIVLSVNAGPKLSSYRRSNVEHPSVSCIALQ